MAFLEVQDVHKTYRGPDGRPHTALRGLSLEVASGEFAAVVGPSGCGKTTLLRLISGLDRDYEGRISLADSRIGFVFQEPRLLPWMTAGENVKFVLPAPDGAADAYVRERLASVRLAAFASAYPYQLSIGMQQRVALARAFAIRPRLLLMDEPFSALDEVTARRVADHLQALWQAEHPTVLMVTHRVEEAVALADRIWVLTAGPGRVWASVAPALGHPRPPGPAFWTAVEQVRAAARDAAATSPDLAPE